MGETSYQSKKLMMRAEKDDTIELETLGLCTIIQRVPTYFGPKFRIEPQSNDDTSQYILHCPGPRSELFLSSVGGDPIEEVKGKLVDSKKYDICLRCGEPLKSAEHRRLSLIDACQTAPKN